ncbi:alkaline/neutral invertase cinv2 [Phtheirospermum japonicum]|uniref:Alkaline/neutral invertase cinv2 n=1 Tax=Phtheirospermum japonicum TaxID=374723 RepID=A0A830DCQ5_9LAMI|nr:alkaline/neutral invertase cinv2 [Phtheirospermum japonicum]
MLLLEFPVFGFAEIGGLGANPNWVFDGWCAIVSDAPNDLHRMKHEDIKEGARVMLGYVNRILSQLSLIRESSMANFPWSGVGSRAASKLRSYSTVAGADGTAASAQKSKSGCKKDYSTSPRSFHERPLSKLSISLNRGLDYYESTYSPGRSALDTPTSSAKNSFEPHLMVADAWEAFRRSLVHFRGQPVGIIVAYGHSSEDVLNYD